MQHGNAMGGRHADASPPSASARRARQASARSTTRRPATRDRRGVEPVKGSDVAAVMPARRRPRRASASQTRAGAGHGDGRHGRAVDPVRGRALRRRRARRSPTRARSRASSCGRRSTSPASSAPSRSSRAGRRPGRRSSRSARRSCSAPSTASRRTDAAARRRCAGSSRSSLRFRFLVVAAAAALMVFGAAASSRDAAGRRLPGVRAAARRGPDRLPRPLRRGDRGARHRPARAGAQRRRRACDEIRSTSVAAALVDRADLQARHRPIEARQLVQERLATVAPTLPTWAAPPVMMPPVSATSRVMKIGLTSKTISPAGAVDDRLLEDPRAAAARARRGQRRDLGRAPAAGARRGRPGAAAAPTSVSLDEVMNATADVARRRPAALRRLRHVIGTGGFVETPNQRLSVRHVLPIHTAATTWRRSPVARSAAASRCGSATSRKVVRGPAAARSATRSSTTAPACCSSSRSARARTRSRSPRASRTR